MTIKQCYEAMGADYENVSQRIPSEAMIKKFATKFPEDESFTQLTDALKNGNAEIAFRAVHTMKGLCLTLGLLGKEKKSGGEKQTENPAKSSAEAETATINEENNTNA